MRAAAVAILGVLLASPAAAHHPAAEQSAGHAQPRSLIGVETDVAGFDIGGVSGNYVTTALRGDYAPTEWLVAGVRFPFSYLSLSTGGSSTGIGDLILVAKVRIIGAHHSTLSAGVGAELPTGDEHAGIGSGHVEVTPFVSAMHSIDRVMLHGTVADNLSLTGDEDHLHPNYLSPHTNHELLYHLGVAYSLRENLFANLAAHGITVLAAAGRGETVLSLSPQLGWGPTDNWLLSAGVQIPLTHPRFDWKALASVLYLF